MPALLSCPFSDLLLLETSLQPILLHPELLHLPTNLSCLHHRDPGVEGSRGDPQRLNHPFHLSPKPPFALQVIFKKLQHFSEFNVTVTSFLEFFNRTQSTHTIARTCASTSSDITLMRTSLSSAI